MMEIVLGVLNNVCIDHEMNCRLLMSTGLDILISIAERGEASLLMNNDERVEVDHFPPSPSSNMKKMTRAGKSCASMAIDLLSLIGPYNYILCTNCGSRETGGSVCSQCAHKIRFEAITSL